MRVWKGMSHFREQATVKRQAIQKYLWDDEEGFFYDRNSKIGKQIKVKTGAAFIPLWAGVPTEAQASRLIDDHQKNWDEFWTDCPDPSYARSEEAYTQYYQPGPHANPVNALTKGHANWCGGTWPHWNYMIIHSLTEYGYDDVAETIADRYHDAVVSHSDPYEWYNT